MCQFINTETHRIPGPGKCVSIAQNGPSDAIMWTTDVALCKNMAREDYNCL